ncbi:hypothetical protein D6C79_09374 [Aureobasidium pullulans]|nr:hypothetical protein D6C79_09374 [Aureobasidium pullulans]
MLQCILQVRILLLDCKCTTNRLSFFKSNGRLARKTLRSNGASYRPFKCDRGPRRSLETIHSLRKP